MKMIKKLVVCIIALTFTSVDQATCDVVRFGKCPKVEVQQDFDINKFKGEWFEIAKNPMFIFGNTRCNKVIARLSNNSDLDVTASSTHKTMKTHFIFDAKLLASNSTSPARLTVQYPLHLFKTTLNIPYWILSTDYDTALIWSCTDFAYGFLSVQYFWFLARKPYMNDRKFNDLKAALEAYGINTNYMVKNELMGCT